MATPRPSSSNCSSRSAFSRTRSAPASSSPSPTVGPPRSASSTCGVSTAQIEDVGTLGGYRGRGLARAVVLRALAEAGAAGCDLVFLEADEDDWPKELYRRLGFEPIGRIFAFLRKPAD